MTGNSDQQPKRFVWSAGMLQFRYNIKSTLPTADKGAGFSYSYVNAKHENEKSVLEALNAAKVKDADKVLAEAGEVVSEQESIVVQVEKEAYKEKIDAFWLDYVTKRRADALSDVRAVERVVR